MYILKEPSFFFTNNIGAPNGEILGLMKPLSRRCFNCSFNSLSSAGAILLGEIEIGWESGKRLIPKSISFREEPREDLFEIHLEIHKVLELTQKMEFKG